MWRIIDNHHASTPISLNYLINCLYFSAGTLGCYFWFMYAEISQGGWASRRQRNAWLVLLPALGLIGITIASCRTGWVFSIDENNRYLRGPLHLWQLGLSFAYVLLTSAKALCKAFQKKHFERRMELLSLCLLYTSFMSGADYTTGREDKATYNEPHAQDQADNQRMGNTLFFKAVRRDHPVPFTPPIEVYHFTEDQLRFRHHGNVGSLYSVDPVSYTHLSPRYCAHLPIY